MPLPPLDGLENHCTGNGTGGSNPSPSAKFGMVQAPPSLAIHARGFSTTNVSPFTVQLAATFDRPLLSEAVDVLAS